jgi:hypothetical protein
VLQAASTNAANHTIKYIQPRRATPILRP